MFRSACMSLVALSFVFSTISAVPASAQERLDMRKSIIENPLKTTINPLYRPLTSLSFKRPRMDVSKSGIERPLKAVIAPPIAAVPVFEEKVVRIESGVQKCEPGAVAWRTDFEAACAAAKASSKPVLLFAMLGKLDDKFC